MPEALQDYIDYCDNFMKAMGDDTYEAIANNFSSMHDSLSAEGNPNSGDNALALKDNFQDMQMFYNSFMGLYRGKLIDVFNWINANWPTNGNGEVTMDAIINAMLKADFNQLQKFIGIVDAYRVALWNAPFNAEMYAALARGFQTWPQY